ncbi:MULTISPECIES: hypothetical protein [unclassified Micromonospora]|uniref:hypothetical protein n=1 Tax=unclassified Micromonospora TaxID=2617518 RepID=UPI0022C6CCF9|nr:hypothetical protein [Micromonospora sp. AKA38]GHJ14982.1 hypothetical protein TPA0908_29770 [Micromonospora sp. AKA38]
MGILCDYFSASTDETAAAVADVLGGPRAASEPGFDVVELKGLEPTVQLGTLEALLTSVDYDVVTRNPRQGKAVAIHNDGEVLVISLTDELRAALAAASESRLREVAAPWSETEEFWGQAEPSILAEALIELAGLARRAATRGERLYCWVCV